MPRKTFRKMTPGAISLSEKLGVSSIEELARLNLRDLESLRDSVSAAQYLLQSHPDAGTTAVRIWASE